MNPSLKKYDFCDTKIQQFFDLTNFYKIFNIFFHSYHKNMTVVLSKTLHSGTFLQLRDTVNTALFGDYATFALKIPHWPLA